MSDILFKNANCTVYIYMSNLQLRIPDKLQRLLWSSVVALTDRFPILFPYIQNLYAALCVPFLFASKQKRVFCARDICLPVYKSGRFNGVVRLKEGDSRTLHEMKRLLRAKNKSDTIDIISRYPTLFYIL